MEEYSWYKIVEGNEILQGDFLNRCPVIIPQETFLIQNPQDHPQRFPVGIQTYDVVVMSQSCDLEQQKIELVLVCPHWSLEDFEKADPYFKSAKSKEQLRRGNVIGYHMLAACDSDGVNHGIRVVDFRTVFSLPFTFLKDFAQKSGKRIRLLSPYREHLSQAFARFFMRVGLPADIPPFK